MATALLFYDLLVRRELVATSAGSGTVADPRPSQQSWDPSGYSDEDRPKGWYVDPENPERMRYWDDAGESPGWKGSTRTPRKLRRARRKKD